MGISDEVIHRSASLLRDGDLVEMAQAGREDALESLFHRHRDRIYTIAYGVVGNHADARDVVQETFIRAFKRLHRLRKDGAVGSYLCRTARNAAIDVLRKKQSTETISFDGTAGGDWEPKSAGPTPQDALGLTVAKEALSSAIGALSEDHRLVIVMHHIEELPVDEIADSLRIPVGTVKSRLGRAREALRRKLIGPIGSP